MFFVFLNDTDTTQIYTYLHTLSLHDALPISALAPSAFPLMTPTILRIRSSPSIQKIALGERQLGRRLADELLAVGAHLIGFGVDLDVMQRVLPLHLGLAYPACVPYGHHPPVENGSTSGR